MSEISIKVNIGNRTYPITVQAHEEEVIRQAAKTVNDSVKVLQDNYAVKDMQDLLAMTALQLASKIINSKSDHDKSQHTSQLTEINALLDQSLNKF